MLFISSLFFDMKIPVSHESIAIGINYRPWFKTGPSPSSSSTRNSIIRSPAGPEGFKGPGEGRLGSRFLYGTA